MHLKGALLRGNISTNWLILASGLNHIFIGLSANSFPGYGKAIGNNHSCLDEKKNNLQRWEYLLVS